MNIYRRYKAWLAHRRYTRALADHHDLWTDLRLIDPDRDVHAGREDS